MGFLSGMYPLPLNRTEWLVREGFAMPGGKESTQQKPQLE
jgi:hypothetical protein